MRATFSFKACFSLKRFTYRLEKVSAFKLPYKKDKMLQDFNKKINLRINQETLLLASLSSPTVPKIKFI